MTEKEYERLKKIPKLMKDEEWWHPSTLEDKIGVGSRKIRTLLQWLVGETDQYFRKYETIYGGRYGGGETVVYFKREPPEQRSLADFV